MKGFLIALQFLTRVPLNLSHGITKEELPRSMLYYPLVGLAIGSLLVIANFSLSRFLPSAVMNVLVLILLILITGGLHLDGFADTLDGLYAGRNREEVLRIMKDPHIGVMGVVGLICLLLLKFTLLQNLSREVLNFALLLMPVLARWAMVMAAAVYPYARSEGTGKPYVNQIRPREWLGATLITMATCAGLMKLKGLVLLIVVLAVAFAFAALIKRKIGGMTGDTLGAIGEVIEVFVLLIICMLSPLRF